MRFTRIKAPLLLQMFLLWQIASTSFKFFRHRITHVHGHFPSKDTVFHKVCCHDGMKNIYSYPLHLTDHGLASMDM